jgi:hypothetical protein
MDISALAAGTAIQQTQASVLSIKQAAKAEKAIVDMVSQAADRGKSLNVLA